MTGRRSRPSGVRIVIALGAALLVLIALLRVLGPSPHRPISGRRAAPPGGRHRIARLAPQTRTPPEQGKPTASDSPRLIAVVIDDVGFDESMALDFARLGLPMTFAILPHQRYSIALASRLREMGHEVILHLPMQPVGRPGSDPGEGAVTEGLSRDEIRAIVEGDLESVPGAVGLNNHMGSQATTDPILMRAVLEVTRERGLFFLDSRTTSATVAYDLAVEMGIPAARRTVFLDDRRERSYIEAQVRSLLERARMEGIALAIGHPDQATLDALKESTGLLRSPDIRMVPVSTLAGAGGQGAG